MRPGEFVFGADGSLHALAEFTPVFEPERTVLVYLRCDADCESASPRWSDALGLATFESGPDDAEEARLFVDADGRPHVAQFDDGAESHIELMGCRGDCTALSGWEVSRADLVFDASTIEIETETSCTFLGTRIDAPTRIGSPAASFEITPSWYCGSAEFESVDANGNREIDVLIAVRITDLTATLLTTHG